MATKPPVRLRALELAAKEIGVHEIPPGSNWGPRVSQYIKSAGYTSPVPWCMCFCHFIYKKLRVDVGGWGSVGMFETWARDQGYQLPARPLKGDLVCYRWDADNWPDHVGFVEKVLALRWRKDGSFAGWCQTIEGNTSPGSAGSQANGGGVYRRRRWINRAKFVRIPG